MGAASRAPQAYRRRLISLTSFPACPRCEPCRARRQVTSTPACSEVGLVTDLRGGLEQHQDGRSKRGPQAYRRRLISLTSFSACPRCEPCQARRQVTSISACSEVGLETDLRGGLEQQQDGRSKQGTPGVQASAHQSHLLSGVSSVRALPGSASGHEHSRVFRGRSRNGSSGRSRAAAAGALRREWPARTGVGSWGSPPSR